MHLVSIILSAYEPIIIDTVCYIGCNPVYAIFVVLFALWCIASYCGLGTNDNHELLFVVYIQILCNIIKYTYTSYTVRVH